MATQNEIMAGGHLPPLTAQTIVGTSGTVASAGSTITDATPLSYGGVNTLTGSAGVRLPTPNPGDFLHVSNYSGNSISVYPHSSTAKLNNGSAGAAVTLATSKNAIYFSNGTDWFQVLTA